MPESHSIIDGLHSAILRLATFKNKGSSDPSELFFASLEFVHADRPVPDSQELNDKVNSATMIISWKFIYHT